MNDTLSLFLDVIIFFVFFFTRIVAISYGTIGIATHQVEFIATGVLIYLISNDLEKILDKRLKK